MKMFLFGIRDSKVAGFGNPMVFQARGQAIRSVADEINGVHGSEVSVLKQHPEDFELFELGSFDTDTGVIEPKLESVCPCSDLKIQRDEAVTPFRQRN
jgi:hypothetical protein